MLTGASKGRGEREREREVGGQGRGGRGDIWRRGKGRWWQP
ncbi:unnamed protein product [Spirodela intermedia]|uniref:Uncharacterized protein n=1 Tax=Spirodela intermedia TaxID=51605 RepID=A0A7I8ICQ4_SPIIN|nr:unnamed protein product [Spirodela intermedia]CAA6655401.1 unnamed protein product [Spirodela intermedia]